MNCCKNEHGSVLVFITLMIVLLLVMVGMGLDTGHLAYVRSQGQPAVDAAALAAASGVPISLAEVQARAARYNATNDFQGSSNSTYQITNTNVTLVSYTPGANPELQMVTDITTANGARVALEDTNHLDAAGTANKAMKSPLFLTPLFNLMGNATSGTQSVSVTATAVVKAQPDLPIAVEDGMCGTKSGTPPAYTQQQAKLLQSNTKSDTSGYTTFYINAASKTQVSNLLQGSLNCTGAPSVDIGFCTQLNNGQIASLYDEFQSVFLADRNRCYFVPVITKGTSFTGCSNILDFAKFCPLDCVDCGFGGKTPTFGIDKVSGGGSDRWVYGNLTCGQTPTRSLFAKCQVPFLVRDTKSGM